MWKARVFTLYPEIYPGPLNKGLYGKALEKKFGTWRLSIFEIQLMINIKQLMTNHLEEEVECS